MSKTIRTLTAVAILAVVALAVLATGARAATPSCGPSCVEPYTKLFLRHQILDVQGGGFGSLHQKLILWRASNGDLAQDFTFSEQGTVPQLVADGLLPPVMLLHYSGDRGFELQYTPLGLDSGFCVGTWNFHPAPGNILRLVPCGVDARTIWIVDHFGTDGNDPGYGNIIQGTNTSFSNPLVWTYPFNAAPTDFPRPGIQMFRLGTFSNGTHPFRQQWGATFGVEP